MNVTASKRPLFVLFFLATALSFSACFREEVILFCQIQAVFAGDPVVFDECSESLMPDGRVISLFTVGGAGLNIFSYDLEEGSSQTISPDGISASFNMGGETYSAQSGDLTFDKIDEEEKLLSGEASFVMVGDSSSGDFTVSFENVKFD